MKQLQRREGWIYLQVDKDVELKNTSNAGAAHLFCFGSFIRFQHTCVNSLGHQIKCLREHVDTGLKVSSRLPFFYLLLLFSSIASSHSVVYPHNSPSWILQPSFDPLNFNLTTSGCNFLLPGTCEPSKMPIPRSGSTLKNHWLGGIVEQNSLRLSVFLVFHCPYECRGWGKGQRQGLKVLTLTDDTPCATGRMGVEYQALVHQHHTYPSILLISLSEKNHQQLLEATLLLSSRFDRNIPTLMACMDCKEVSRDLWPRTLQVF